MNWNEPIQWLRKLKPDTYQNEVELGYILYHIEQNPPQNYIEIGTMYGGSLWIYGNGCVKGSTLISIDPIRQNTVNIISEQLSQNGYDVHVLSKGSIEAQAEVSNILSEKKVGLLHIDGNHDLAFQDWNNYRKFVSSGGIIVVHDIFNNDWPNVNLDWIKIKSISETEGLKWKEFGFPSRLISFPQIDRVMGVGIIFV